MEHISMLIKNKTTGLLDRLFRSTYKSTLPAPYKGQRGPIKKPLLTNLFNTTNPKRTSKHQPAKEKNIKHKNNFAK